MKFYSLREGLESWPGQCEMLLESVKAASQVAVLALYSKSEECAKHVPVRVRPPIFEAMIGDEKSHLIFLQALVSICSQVQLLSLVVSVWLLVCSTCPKLC